MSDTPASSPAPPVSDSMRAAYALAAPETQSRYLDNAVAQAIAHGSFADRAELERALQTPEQRFKAADAAPSGDAVPVTKPGTTLNAHKLPTISPAQVNTGRPAWDGMYEANARARGEEPSAAGRKEWNAKFDAAAKAEGFIFGKADDAPEISDETAAWDEAHGFDIVPTSLDYHPVYATAAELGPERTAAVNAEMTEWAAGLGLPPAIGTAVIEHIAEWGPKLAAMAPAERAAWVRDQRLNASRSLGGDPAAVAEERKLALSVLGKGGSFSEALQQSTALESRFLIATLANHARRVQAWQSGRPGKK